MKNTKLKYEHLGIGTRIRAYDFEPMTGRRNRYVEGKIVDKTVTEDHWKALVIECDTDSSYPEGEGRVGIQVFVPMEVAMEYNGRVAVMSR
jgi:hypothetical protein